MGEKGALILLGDEPILRFNFKGNIEVLRNDLLPLCLRDSIKSAIRSNYNSSNIDTFYDLRDDAKNSIVTWLASRTISLSRKHSKKLYNTLTNCQDQSPINKAKIALMYRAVSASDSYWVKSEMDLHEWSSVNVRHVSLNEIITQIALHGTSLSIQGELNTPEYSTMGAYAKAWRRRPDGKLWLLKANDNKTSMESNVEVMVSNLLDKTNVKHCHYEADYDDGLYVAACPNMADDSKSIVHGVDFASYCNRMGLNLISELRRLNEKLFYQMFVVDYIITNIDRHGQNWGVYMDNTSGEIIDIHELYDHNNAFDADDMKQEDFQHNFSGKSAKESAIHALPRSGFEFTGRVTKHDFLTKEMWESFKWRCKVLGLKYN